MLNSVVLAGNLGNDPDIHFSSTGDPIASFNLAFRAGKGKTGWIRVTVFSKLAEITEKHLHKGAKIAVSGVLDHSQWETNEGIKKSVIQMIANNIEFIKVNRNSTEDGQDQGEETPF